MRWVSAPGRHRAGMFVLAACVLAAAPLAAADAGGETRLRQLQQEIEQLRRQLERSARERAADRRRLEELEREIRKVRERATAAAPRPAAQTPNVFNPRLTVFGDAVGRVDDRPVRVPESRERVDDTFNLREVETDLRAAIDPYADGLLILAVESEVPGEFEIAVEEGYATIKHLPFLERPPLGMSLKVGRFRTELGRINLLHTHDLPQTALPLVVEEFLGPEGHIAEGLSARFLLPSLIDRESAWELTAQVVTGGRIAVADGTRREPGWIGNLRWSRVFAAAHFADASLIVHTGATDPRGRRHATTLSVDALYKWQPPRRGLWRSFLLGGQAFWSDRNLPRGAGEADGREIPARSEHPFGGFLFAQYQLDRRTYLGLRGDWTTRIDDDGRERAAVQPYASYYFSEFLRLRLGWEHRWSDLPEEDGRDSVLAQLTFVFGSHPPEPFWVNR